MPPFLLGLTGSIAMGKSTVAKQFAYLGVPTTDADEIVHRLYAKGGKAVALIAGLYPQVIEQGAVNRRLLGKEVLASKEKLRELERIIHPLVRQAEADFIQRMARLGHDVILLDIPLLYETHSEDRFDAVAVVTAPAFLQKQRAMRRPGMTEEKFNAILAQQMPDVEKRARADFIIPTGLGRSYSMATVKQILDEIRHAPDRPRHGNHRLRP